MAMNTYVRIEMHKVGHTGIYLGCRCEQLCTYKIAAVWRSVVQYAAV